jgi:hypothetical protein
MKPFKKFDQVYIARRVPGSPYVIGDRVTIISVTNTATKKNPVFRYYVAGAWIDHDALSETNPLAGMV